jgi:hypothetical protein
MDIDIAGTQAGTPESVICTIFNDAENPYSFCSSKVGKITGK